MASNSNQGGGFGRMDPKKQREIASMGGRAAHESGNAHEFTSEEARKAGRKGGEEVSRDRQHMAEIGRLGGEASHGSRSGGQRGGAGSPGTQAGAGSKEAMGNRAGDFHGMSEEEQREMARKGGESSHGGAKH